MSWMQTFEVDKPELEKAMRTPIGAFSPLWWAFAGVAGAGVAYWWMTRWSKPVNLEAMALDANPTIPALEEAAAAYEMSPEAIQDVVDTPAMQHPEVELAEIEGDYEIIGDDLTQLVGVGPKLAIALAERGVHHFAQVAAWSEDDLTYFDRELNLKGRAGREAWVEQAKALSGEFVAAPGVD